MKKSTLLLLSALAVSISSCGARDESKPLFGSAAAPTTTENSSGGTVSENTDDSTSLGEANPDSGSDSLAAQGLNPGQVPSTILAELTTLSAVDASAMRGHKVFAGLPHIFESSNYEYFNLDFPCDGDGRFEAYPSEWLEDAPQESAGNFYWTGVDIIDTNVYWALGVTEITTGDLQGVLIPSFLSVDPVVRGDIIVNTAFIEQQPVTRIVQYDEC